MTLAATVQRSPTYQENLNESHKTSVRNTLRKHLIQVSVQYREKVSEAEHCANIENLANVVTNQHKNVLYENQFRIGSAQKALNLYLKYLWCLNRIEMPPHCPIDADVIAKLDTCKNVKWTKITDMKEYQAIIREVRGIAEKESQPIAEWELQFYNAAP